MISDAHSHLDAFGVQELESALKEARAVGVGLIITVGMDLETSARGVSIAESESFVCAAVGLHPWMAQDHPGGAPIERLRSLATHDKVVAVGEIGLDFVDNLWRGLSYRDLNLQRMQEKVFRQQLRLARSLELPVILHSRGAHETVTKILFEEQMDDVGGCIQFQDGTPEDVRRYQALGFTFSVGSSVTFPDSADWQETVRSIPADALLLESDAPWLPYCGKQSDRSSPSDLTLIGETLARVRGVDPEKMFATATDTLVRVFPKLRALR